MNVMKKRILFALLLSIAAQGVWGDLPKYYPAEVLKPNAVEGPWTWDDVSNGVWYEGKEQDSFKQLNRNFWEPRDDWNHPTHNVIYQWQDGDGVGFTQCSKSSPSTHFAVYSTYCHDKKMPSYTRSRMVWKFRLKGRTTEFPQCITLYAHEDKEALKAMPVDFTYDYRNGAGKEFVIAQFKMPKDQEEKETGDYTREFDFDNRYGATEQTIQWTLMLTNSMWANSKQSREAAHQWGAFKHRGVSWINYYYKYVTYDKNASYAEGTMDVQEIENADTLYANTFTNPGFTLVGWATSPDGPVVYTDQDIITATKKDKGPVTLYAVWETNVEAVTDLIKRIGIVDNTPECKKRIDIAREAYDNLSPADKAKIKNYCILLIAEHVYQAQELIEAADATEYSDALQPLIDAARDAYDALSVLEKAFVNNYNTLVETEDKYDPSHAYALINALPDSIVYPGSEEAVNAALTAFTKLSENAQAKLSAAVLEKLQSAVEAYEAMGGKSTIRFVDNESQTIRTQVLELNYPVPPVIAGFTFLYWQAVGEYIMEDEKAIIIRAVYKYDTPTDMDETPFPSGEGRGEASKFIKEGNVYILKDEFIYTINGAKVK